MPEEEAETAIQEFRDHRIDHDELYDRLVSAGKSPEEAQEMVNVECDIDD